MSSKRLPYIYVCRSPLNYIKVDYYVRIINESIASFQINSSFKYSKYRTNEQVQWCNRNRQCLTQYAISIRSNASNDSHVVSRQEMPIDRLFHLTSSSILMLYNPNTYRTLLPGCKRFHCIWNCMVQGIDRYYRYDNSNHSFNVVDNFTSPITFSNVQCP